MSALKGFAPHSMPDAPAKAAKVAKENSADRLPRHTLASLATLAARPAESASDRGIRQTRGQPHEPRDSETLMNQEAMRRLSNLRTAPRCGARTRAGTRCQCPAIRGRSRCRLHGGLSPGAPKGQANGKYKDGYFTAEAISERRWAKSLVGAFTEKEKNG
jgi:hypothetical protein